MSIDIRILNCPPENLCVFPTSPVMKRQIKIFHHSISMFPFLLIRRKKTILYIQPLDHSLFKTRDEAKGLKQFLLE
jgi:hypothetical protein